MNFRIERQPTTRDDERGEIVSVTWEKDGKRYGGRFFQPYHYEVRYRNDGRFFFPKFVAYRVTDEEKIRWLEQQKIEELFYEGKVREVTEIFREVMYEERQPT